ncbi:putative signal peptide protein [Roseibium sp. TrichSKD4]|uniref:hypothetical protein n=1 Tax=Roseibium sp. TrichSKD4 TaxID=744980 RepID=UPI0001E5642A|nr:hypothetical protein [Roseibium sp. TrichSKD4]EFO33078.1 putative signal peptide protein [Roseibium sp. TrichSKD4]
MTVVRFVVRLFGYALLASAVIALIADGSYSIAQSELATRSFGQVWFTYSAESLNLAQAVIQRHVSPVIWDPIIQTLLTWPVWAVTGPLAILFLWLTTPGEQLKRAYA